MNNNHPPPAAPSAVLQPGIIEAISPYISRPSDVLGFLNVVPRALLTPTTAATAAFWRHPPVGMTLAWPVLTCGTDASKNPLPVLRGLRELLPLGLRVELRLRATRPHHLDLFQKLFGPNITLVTLQLARDREYELGDRDTLVDLVLLLPALTCLVVHVPNADVTSPPMVHTLQRLLASTSVPSLQLTLEPKSTVQLPVASALTTWLRKECHRLVLDAPLVHDRSTPDEVNTANAFLDALSASSLQELDVHHRCGLGTLPHLVLPRGLRRLRWHVAIDNAVAVEAFAHALEDLARLEFLDTNCLDALRLGPRLQPFLARVAVPVGRHHRPQRD